MNNTNNFIHSLLVLILLFSVTIFPSCSDSDSGSDMALYPGPSSITEFSVKAAVPFTTLTVEFPGEIDDSNITVPVPEGTDVTVLAASFTSTGINVSANGIVQESGITTNDFTNDVIYTVTAETGFTHNYTVSVAGSIPIYKGDYLIDGALKLSNLSGTIGVTGNLKIGPTSLNNLLGLEMLRFVLGDVEISGNTSLTTLDGLDNLIIIGGNLDINNNGIIELDGLSSLCSVGDDFTITDNPNLCKNFAADLLTLVEGCDGIGGVALNSDNGGTCP